MRDLGIDTLLPADRFDSDGDLAEPFPFDYDRSARIAGAAVDPGVFEVQAVPVDVPLALWGLALTWPAGSRLRRRVVA